MKHIQCSFIIHDSSSCCTELVVAESVVVIKKLLQMQPEKHSDIIKHMAKLTDNIQVRVSFTNCCLALKLLVTAEETRVVLCLKSSLVAVLKTSLPNEVYPNKHNHLMSF